jgi:hypothetical protein
MFSGGRGLLNTPTASKVHSVKPALNSLHLQARKPMSEMRYYPISAMNRL